MAFLVQVQCATVAPVEDTFHFRENFTQFLMEISNIEAEGYELVHMENFTNDQHRRLIEDVNPISDACWNNGNECPPPKLKPCCQMCKCTSGPKYEADGYTLTSCYKKCDKKWGCAKTPDERKDKCEVNNSGWGGVMQGSDQIGKVNELQLNLQGRFTR